MSLLNNMEFKYCNPITKGKDNSLRDNHIIKVGDIYYMTGTCQPVWEGPNPGIKLFSSRDLINWTFERMLIDRDDLLEDCWYKDRFWAPEIHRGNGKFYLTFNCRNDKFKKGHNYAMAVADNIEGPYVVLTKDKPMGECFKNDLSIFIDDDEKGYAYCSGGGIWQTPIDLKTGYPTEGNEFVKIFDPQDEGNPDWMKMGIEGPFVIKREGTYYMFISAWTRGYEIGYAKSAHPLGPWVMAEENPVLVPEIGTLEDFN